MHKLVLLRHGQSQWSLENRFTGWHDVDLTDQGREEARSGGQVLKENGFVFDKAHTSVLKRAIRTLWIALDELDQMWLPVRRDWRLNERHYGALQGLNKAETAQKHGEEQVLIWRRAYDIPPPALEPDDERYPGHDARYADLTGEQLPLTECLKDTVDRFLTYWHEAIVYGALERAWLKESKLQNVEKSNMYRSKFMEHANQAKYMEGMTSGALSEGRNQGGFRINRNL